MKKSMKMVAMLVGIVAGMGLVGCINEKEVFEPGSEIRFTASSSGLETRTEYGGTGTVSGHTVQFINWQVNDGMTILMVPPSGSAATRNYKVSEVSTPTDQTSPDASRSAATIGPVGGNALTWASVGIHTFYAMYPAGTYESDQLQGSIPAEQSASESMPYGYMFADPVVENVAASKSVDEVELYFRPYFTAFQFTLTNSDPVNDVVISTFTLTSATKAMNGAIAYNVSSTPTVSHKENTDVSAEKTITVDGMTVPHKDGSADGSVTFIITVLPNEFASGDLTATFSDGADVKSLTLTGYTFGAGLKHNITIPAPAFTSYEYSFEVINPTDLAYDGSSSSSAKVVSYKTPSGGGTPEAVSWTVAGYYDTYEKADKPGTYADNSTYSTNNLLKAAISDGSGAVSSSSASATVSFSYNSGTTSSSSVSVLNTQLASSSFGAGSSSDSPYNLSNPRNMTSNNIVESANCYIVNGPGYYKIPLVMGNGVKANSANTSAFNVSGYVDYAGVDISSASSAWLKDRGDVSDDSADIVWTDAAGVVGDLSNDDNWLYFSVGKGSTTITQSNTVIKVTDGTNVMWSYHIWVTPYVPFSYGGSPDVLMTRGGSNANKSCTVMPQCLGWVAESGDMTIAPESTVFVRLRQTETSDVKVMKITRPYYCTPTSNTVGRSPFYEWGRKDPLRNTFNYSSSSSQYYSDYNNNISSNSVSVHIKTSIQNPTKYYKDWLSSHLNSLWSTTFTTTSDYDYQLVNKKSIYDPSPAGYSVMFNKALGYSSTDGLSYSFSNGFLTITDNDGHKLHFYKNGAISGGSSYNLGRCNFWTCVATNSSSAKYYKIEEATTGILTTSGGATTYGVAVLPIQDTSYNPTNDGT